MYGRSSDRITYNNHQLMRIVPQNEDELEALADLEDEPGVLFWGRPAANLSLDMVVAPNVADDVKQHLADSNMDYTVLNVNVQVRHYRFLNNTLTDNVVPYLLIGNGML